MQSFLDHVAELSAEDKQLIVHCGLEDLTCAEVAVQLGLSEDAVIKRWQRLRARLRDSVWVRGVLALES